ncbi:MAG: extracellular solute-binding protein [Blautia sp.]|nr:extracellular solute-binding protein [Lachnoclostridium sp.]MCM1212123.1 extracellular solute-binding protein [Blautia sp.]
MKKRFVALLLMAAMTVATLTGCGGGDDSSQGSAPADTGDAAASDSEAGGGDNAASGEVQDISLKVWCPQNQVDTGIMEQQQAAFAEAHPEYNITWTTEIVGEDTCQESVLKDVGAAADVFMFASDQLPSLVEAGAIARLGGETETMVRETIAESVVATAMIDDAVYAIPFTHNTFFMFYDKTLLDESDIGSIESIMAKETADNVYNFYFESSGGWKLGCYYYGAGLRVFGESGSDLAAGVDWNNETGVAVTNYLIDLINNPKCAYDGEISVSELVEDHRLGAWFDGSWNYDLYAGILGDDLGLAIIPTFNPDGNDYQLLGFYGSKCIGVNAQSQNMAAAVAFAAFLGNEENQILRYEMSAQIPANIAAGSSEAVMSDPLATVIVDEANNASVAQPANSVFSSRYWTYAGAIPTEIRSGEITKANVQEKLDAFVEAMTAE